MQYGLIGRTLQHSHSPRLHALLGDETYRLVPLDPEALGAFLTEGDFLGLNVTIPYKRDVIPYCTELGDTARRVGSVNTLVRRPDGRLFGDNTDAYGFAKMAERAGIDFRGKKALVLGSGGTSLTAVSVIREAGGEAVVISRQGEDDYAHLERHADAQVIVNATPVGMYPNAGASPVDLTRFTNLTGVLDAVYNPLRTRLLQQAEALGVPCAGGLTMLTWQAARARELFDGRAVAPERVQAAEATLRREVSNLVLIGMPGSGKTLIGERCAQALGLPFADTDAEVERRAGKPIPQIFAEEGESAFRTWEAEAVAAICAHGGQVVSTGGGAVLREENRQNLRMNGVVVCLTRPLEKLSTGGRPLSAGLDALRRMEAQRAPLYKACADAIIANNTTVEQAVRAVLEVFDEAFCH